MSQLIVVPPSHMDNLLAYVLGNKKQDLVALLQKHSVAVTSASSIATVQIAVLAAIRDDQDFRNDFSVYLGNLVKKDSVAAKNNNFIGQPVYLNASGKMNAVDDYSYIDYSQDSVSDADMNNVNYAVSPGLATISGAAPASAVIAPGSISTQAPGSSQVGGGSSGGFWSNLGSAFNAATISNIINTGVNVYGAKLQADANKGLAQNALTAQQLKLAQINAQNQGKQLSTGMSGWAIAGLILGIAGIITVIVIVAKKKKKV